MKIDELISELEQVKEEHGNLEVKAGGTKTLVSNIEADVAETEMLGVKEKYFLIASFD